MQQIFVATVVLFMSLLPGAAGAGEPVDQGSSRVYVGAFGVSSWLTGAGSAFSNDVVQAEFGRSFGAAFSYGALMTHNFAVDMDFEWIRGHELDQTSALGDYNDRLATYSLMANLSWHPVDWRVDPYVGVGMGWMRGTLDANGTTGDGFAVRFAAGINVWILDNVGIQAEGRYLLPAGGDIANLESIAPRVGLLTRF